MLTVVFCVMRTAFKPEVCGRPGEAGFWDPILLLHSAPQEGDREHKMDSPCSEQSGDLKRVTRVPLRSLRAMCQAASGAHKKGMLYSHEVIIDDAGQFLGTLSKYMHAQLMNHS